MIHNLATVTGTTTGAQPHQKINSAEGSVEGTIQVEVVSTGTVLVQGRASEEAPWITIASFTASDVKIIALLQQMRVNVTANGSGVNVWLNVPTR